MERKELSDGLYGYEVTTSLVDFEYGFELENAAGNSYKDIGAQHHPAPRELRSAVWGVLQSRRDARSGSINDRSRLWRLR